MSTAETRAYQEMFEYHSVPDLPTKPTETVVFGRHDARLGDTMLCLYLAGKADHFVISGNYGKDSGELWDERVPESRFVGKAFYLQAHRTGYRTSAAEIDYETKALTGDDNARFAVKMMQDQKRDVRTLNAVAHATSARRLAATLETEAENLGVWKPKVYRTPTRYPFNPEDPTDQAEAAAELLRLAYWPEKGWLKPQPDLPEELVGFAHGVIPEVPGRPSSLSKFILRRTPIGLRRIIMGAARS